MIILIDGYNVLKQLDPDRSIGERERNQFIHLLARYAKQKKHKIIVVFDGGSTTWPHKDKIAQVIVVYAGFKKTADDVIMRYIKDYQHKELLLVSSDLELIRYAEKYEKVSIGSEEFYYLVKEADERRASTLLEYEITVELDDEHYDVDALMEAASKQTPVKAEDLLNADRHQDTKNGRLSKYERTLMRIVKKL